MFLLPMILKFGFKVVSHALFMCALWFYGCLMASTSPLSTGILVVHLICLLTRLFKFFYLTFKLFILKFLIGFFQHFLLFVEVLYWLHHFIHVLVASDFLQSFVFSLTLFNIFIYIFKILFMCMCVLSL